MNKMKSIAWIAIAGFLVASSTVKAAEVQDSEQVSKLLSDAKTMAFQLKEDAVAMESFTRMNVSQQSHLAAITQIREHVNALGRQTAKLKEVKATASPWQKTAIDRIEPFLNELGGYISAAIEHLNDKSHSLPEYNDYLEANADYASDLASMVASFVDYGKTKQRLERLGARLEVSASR
jgi:hypothetical protein